MRSIAFWNGMQGKPSSAKNLVAVSIVWAFSYTSKLMITENSWNGFGIREMFGVKTILKQTKHLPYFYGESFYNKTIESASCDIVLLENKLRYIPFSTIFLSEQNKTSLHVERAISSLSMCRTCNVSENKNSPLISCETICVYEERAKCMPNVCFTEEVLLVDVAQGSMSTQIMLEKADLVAVTMTQQAYDMEYFLENYASLLPKTIFLIENYRKTSNYKKEYQYLEKQYHLPKESIGIIPYNSEYERAVQEGRVIEFFNRNFCCNRNNPNYAFIKASKQVTDLLYKAVNK